VWGVLGLSQVLRILHNPRYAGAFAYGRSRTRKAVDGGCEIIPVPKEEWKTLIPGAHAGYVSWDEYEQNQRRLHESAQAIGSDRRKSPAREGPALLQGMIVCGSCGKRMTVRYHGRRGVCGRNICASVMGSSMPSPCVSGFPGAAIDQAIGGLLWTQLVPWRSRLHSASSKNCSVGSRKRTGSGRSRWSGRNMKQTRHAGATCESIPYVAFAKMLRRRPSAAEIASPGTRYAT
jgi:Recombinase/Recombinase zinc beta ribbon domain